jgi:RIO kinase 1
VITKEVPHDGSRTCTYDETITQIRNVREDSLGQNKDNDQMRALEHFMLPAMDPPLIDDVLGTVKSGKEATVYLCEEAGTGELIAAKVYRSRDVRQFANAAAYGEGRMRGVARRDALAMTKKSRAGREMSFRRWLGEEYATLQLLHAAGVAVPEPIAMSESIILMQYIGDEDGPAPALASVRLDPDATRPTFDAIMRNIEKMLALDRVHGDLSAYNILYHEGEIRIIDFPQAVDARFNTNALTLLERDVENICHHFERYGLRDDPHRIARSLWGRFLRSDL